MKTTMTSSMIFFIFDIVESKNKYVHFIGKKIDTITESCCITFIDIKKEIIILGKHLIQDKKDLEPIRDEIRSILIRSNSNNIEM